MQAGHHGLAPGRARGAWQSHCLTLPDTPTPGSSPAAVHLDMGSSAGWARLHLVKHVLLVEVVVPRGAPQARPGHVGRVDQLIAGGQVRLLPEALNQVPDLQVAAAVSAVPPELQGELEGSGDRCMLSGALWDAGQLAHGSGAAERCALVALQQARQGSMHSTSAGHPTAGAADERAGWAHHGALRVPEDEAGAGCLADAEQLQLLPQLAMVPAAHRGHQTAAFCRQWQAVYLHAQLRTARRSCSMAGALIACLHCLAMLQQQQAGTGTELANEPTCGRPLP